jgi:hypothetical protein
VLAAPAAAGGDVTSLVLPVAVLAPSCGKGCPTAAGEA